MPRVEPDLRPSKALHAVMEFYREEFVKHRQCLARQREYFSERAINDADAALARILSQLDQLCSREGGDQVVIRLLRTFDSVTNLSAWTDPTKLH
jgi:hypothetical protein